MSAGPPRPTFTMPRHVRTARLSLEPLRLSHFPAFARFAADEPSNRHIGGRTDRIGAWRRFAGLAGHWWLTGTGPYALIDEAGAFLGYAGLWRPDGWPETEILYGLMPEARGQGYGAEAVAAIRAVAEAAGATSLVSYVARDNAPSLALATRVGAREDGTVALGGIEAVVMRHPVATTAHPAEDDDILLDAAVMPLSIRTARLALVPWRLDHFEAYAAHDADPEAQRHIGGPTDRATAWRGMAAGAGQWALRGYGMYAVERNGVPVGRVGLYHPPHWPERELGWHTYAAHQGKGYAVEAAAAVRAVATEQGLCRLISTIDPANTASRHVAARLGASEAGIVELPRGPSLCLVHPMAEAERGAERVVEPAE